MVQSSGAADKAEQGGDDVYRQGEIHQSLKLQGSHAWLKLLIFNRSASFGMVF